MAEMKTGKPVSFPKLADLPALWAAIPRRKAPDPVYAKHCKLKLAQFADFAVRMQRGIRDFVEVKPETAKAFMAFEEKRGVAPKTWNDALKLLRAPLKPVRVDAFDETGDDATAEQLMGIEIFINAKSLMGELADDLQNGALWVHPTVLAALELADETSFHKVSHGPWTIRTYRGIPIYVSEALVRAGTTNGFVYETYLLARGIVAKGEKPQKSDVVDVAALQMEKKFGLNNEIIYDRTRFVMHLNGMRWVGTPAGESPTNPELATIANWNLVLATANRVGAVCMRTNGESEASWLTNQTWILTRSRWR